MTKNTIVAIALLAAFATPQAAFADNQTDASFCATIETSTISHDRPVCSAIDHLQIALKEIQTLPADGEDHKKQAFNLTKSALEEIQSYVAPVIIADPTSLDKDQK